MVLKSALPVCLQQYFRGKRKWEYMPVAGFAKAFRQTEMAQGYLGELAQPYVAPNDKCDALMTTKTYALTGRFVNFVCCIAINQSNQSSSLYSVLLELLVSKTATAHVCT